MREIKVPGETALRLSGASVLLGDAALLAGIVVSAAYGLGSEALPLTSAEGLQRLGQAADLYPILILPQGIALYSLLRGRTPALLWPLVFWCVGLTLGIAVDVFTVALAREFGVGYLGAAPDARLALEALAGTIAHAVFLAQLVCDNISGTLVYPFFAAAAYWAGLVSQALAVTVVVSSLLVFVAYRGMNLFFAEETCWPRSSASASTD